MDDCPSAASAAVIYIVTETQYLREDSFTAYPNPASDQIVIRWSSSAGGARLLHIFDMLGRRIETHEASGAETVINISSYSQGAYQVVGIQGDTKQHLRFVKK